MSDGRPGPSTAAQPASASTRELSAALTRMFPEPYRGTEGFSLHRRPAAYATSHALEELDVELGDGRSLELVFKDLSSGSMHAEARLAKPAFLYDPAREIAVYEHILQPAGRGTASYFGSSVGAEREQFWLFIERVRGTVLWEIGDLRIWQAVARWLARLHDETASERERLARRARLLRYDADYYRAWMERARRYHRRRYEATRLDWLAARYDAVLQRLLSLPMTVIHGEFYPSNVLVDRRSSRICPVDWEVAAVGPGLIDLAALTGGSWRPADRARVESTYREALPRGHRLRTDQACFSMGIMACRLHLAVQWLGWARNWSPPPGHRHDWLEEAITAAEQLGL